MRRLFLILFSLLLFIGCTNKVAVKEKKEQPPAIVQEQKQRIETLENKKDSIGQKIDLVKKSLESKTEMISGLEDNLSHSKQELSGLKNQKGKFEGKRKRVKYYKRKLKNTKENIKKQRKVKTFALIVAVMSLLLWLLTGMWQVFKK